MKAVVLVLSVYLLGLCCYPCFEDDCSDHDEVQATEAHDKSDDKDACTPFCFDSCCATHIICYTSFFKLPSGDQFNKQPNHLYVVMLVAGVPLAIWQPPRI